MNEPGGRTVERRKAKRNQIQVDIEIADPGAARCRGHVHNISRGGVSVPLGEGEIPPRQRAVILNFKVWTGRETCYLKSHARVVRAEQGRIALEFAGQDFAARAIVQELMVCQAHERRKLG